MKETILIGWDKCGTCRKAQKFLNENNIEYTKRDVMTQTPTAAELTEWIKDSGLPIKRFFNTSGFVYRAMGLKDKLSTMSDEAQIELLASNGRLIKRPLLIGEHGIFVGFHLDLYETLV